jgi:hypothetical protein
MPASSVDLPTSFERYLRAENKSARTVKTYLDAVTQLDGFLETRGVDLAGAGRADIEAFLAGLLARWKPLTAANRYRALRVFYAWLEDEGEIPSDPMRQDEAATSTRAARPDAHRGAAPAVDGHLRRQGLRGAPRPPCQAYPGDALSSLEMPAHRRGVVDRGCQLGAVLVRLM